MKALVLYFSPGGNTRQVAEALAAGLADAGAQVKAVTVPEASSEELYDYDLVCLGAPSYQFQAPEPVLRYVRDTMARHRQRGDIRLRAPHVPGKHAVVFCTYGGPHTGIAEAIPVGKYLGQFFAHIGFDVRAEWYVVGQFHGESANNVSGLLGDIRGRPNEADLAKVRADARELCLSLSAGNEKADR